MSEIDQPTIIDLNNIRIGTPHDVSDADAIARAIVDWYGRGFDGSDSDHWKRRSIDILRATVLATAYSNIPEERSLTQLSATLASVSFETVFAEMISAEHDRDNKMHWIDNHPMYGKNQGTGLATRTHPLVLATFRDLLSSPPSVRSAEMSSTICWLKGFVYITHHYQNEDIIQAHPRWPYRFGANEKYLAT